MKERNQDPVEREIVAAFAREADPVADGGFTDRVMRRIRQRNALRFIVLGGAWIVGGMLAALAAAAIVPDVAGVAAVVAGGLLRGDWPEGYGIVVMAVLGGAASVAVAQMLED